MDLLCVWACMCQRCRTFLWTDLGYHAPGCTSFQVSAHNLQGIVLELAPLQIPGWEW